MNAQKSQRQVQLFEFKEISIKRKITQNIVVKGVQNDVLRKNFTALVSLT